MGFSNENLIKPAHIPGRRVGREVGQKRRALSVINQNLHAYDCVVSKRDISGFLAHQKVLRKKLQLVGLVAMLLACKYEEVSAPVVSDLIVISNNAYSRKDVIEMKLHTILHLLSRFQTIAETWRKPASKIANTGKHGVAQESNKADPNGFGDFIFIDEERKSPIGGQPVPMFLEDTEAVLDEEKIQMEEVEMEDVEEEEEPFSDIDSCDARNPLAAIDYVNDLYAYYRKMECFSCVSPNYMAQQSDINEKMRAILIDWLIEVHDKFELMSETLYLTVNVIDRFLAHQKVLRKKLQLVGLVAMLLACKYEEVSAPVVSDLIVISNNAYSRKDVIEMETLMLNTLEFNMSVPTPYVFMRRYLKAAQSDKKVELLSFFLLELCLVEYEMVKYPPSLLAASAIYTAQSALAGFRRWSRTCERHSSYSQEELLECSRLMMGFHKNAATGRLRAVHSKYGTSKMEYISKNEAAFSINYTDK